MRRLKHFAVLLCVFACLCAQAGNVTGLIQSAGGVNLSNATLTWTPTMFATVSGSFVQTAQSVNCYTDALGNVVGLPNPLVTATAAAANSGTLTAATTYYLQFTYWVGATETAPSPEFAFFLPGGQSSINITAPVLPPSGATGYKVYASTTPGGEKLQQTVTGFGNTSITSLLSVTSVTSSNNTVCSFNFSDSLIPQARYVLNILDSSGSPVPGWPQTYYTQGATFNLNTSFPTNNTTAIFQNAIVSTPSGGATQSIFGSLNLNGFGLTAGAGTFSGNVSVGGTLGVTGLTSFKNLESVRYADQFPGADCGAKIAAADADFPNAKGIIMVNRNCGLTISTWPATGFFGGGNSPQHSIFFIEGGTWSVSAQIKLQHGGVDLSGLGLNDSSTNPGTMLQWTGAAGTDMVSVLGTLANRLDNIVIRDMILDGGGTARYTLRSEKIDDMILRNVRIRQGATAGMYQVDATGLKLQAVQFSQCPSYCFVSDWGTGGLAWNGGNVDILVANSNPGVLLQGANNAMHINNVEFDASQTGAFAGYIQVTGFDTNSSFASAPTGGAGSPSMVDITGSSFFQHSTATAPSQGADILITGTAANPSTKVVLERDVFAGLGVSQAAVKVDFTDQPTLEHVVSNGHTASTLIFTANATHVLEAFVTTATDVARCSGAACGNQADITQGNAGQIVYSSGIAAASLTSVNLLVSSTAPTISAGFGTGATIATNNGTASFTVNVGTGGTANNGTIGLPTATNGWNCTCEDITTTSATVARCKQTGGTASTAVIGNFNTTPAAAAWVASDILQVSCFAR